MAEQLCHRTLGALVAMMLVGYIPWCPHSILSACFGGQGNVPPSCQRAAHFDRLMLLLLLLMMTMMMMIVI